MTPAETKSWPEAELPELAKRVRGRIIDAVASNGGHLASSLGAVELAIGILRAFDPPDDRVLWDVGHQAYAWKILTGREERFGTLRLHGGISPFLNPDESDADAFISGHAGVALAAAAGFAAANARTGGDGRVVAVVGEASLMNGESLEALGNIGRLGLNVIVALNDNGTDAAERGRFEALFKAFGIRYVGPVDGNDASAVEAAFGEAKAAGCAVAVHFVTKKGKGFPPAEENPEEWHSAAAFKAPKDKANAFADALAVAARRDGRVCAVVAAMKNGTGLAGFAEEFPDRFFDVGICEEMAVTFAAGLAKAGMRPVVAIYSAFLQRAIDQIQHDVCLQGLPVVFAVDHAGCVGADGATHHGLYDIALLRPLAGMRIFAPTCREEVGELLDEALGAGVPAAIRYPKGALAARRALDIGSGSQVRILAVGDQVEKALKVKGILAAKGLGADVAPVSRVKPAVCGAAGIGAPPASLGRARTPGAPLLVTIENGVTCGGFGELVGADLKFGWPDAAVGHGTVEELEREFGFDAESIAEAIWQSSMV